ncbi:MAG: 4-alpha-glucanotransferase, partial [Verrucomicrobiales bacterium]
MIGNSQNIAPERSAGLEVPVFAIPREGDLGCGDTQVVHELIDLAKEVGLGSLNLLPIQETVKGNDPFSPLSLFALDPILLDVSPWTLDDLQSVAYDRLTKDVSSSHGSESNALSYNKVKKLKLDLLWQAFEHFWKTHFLEGSSRARDYHRFCKREAAWLPDCSMYRMLMDFEQGRESWEDWSEDYGCY